MIVRQLALLALLALAAWPAAAQSRVQMGITVRPDTVTVGDPFLVMVRVRAPQGTRIAFPAAPDTGRTVEGVDPMSERTEATPGAEDRTAIYRLSAWDTGRVLAELGDVTLSGAENRTLPLQDVAVYVRSVLPADTALHVPKPARDIFGPARAFPWWILGLVAAAILGLLLLWWWWRRRRRGLPDEAEDPYERAQREFERLAALHLVEAGEPGRHVVLAVEVLRDYLGGRLPEAAPSHTTLELLAALRARRDLPLDTLRGLLAEADLVKFARRPVTAERARAFGGEAQAVVRQVEEAEQARQSAEAARAAEPPRAA